MISKVNILYNFRAYILKKRSWSLSNRLKLPEKWKGGRLEKWGEFWKALSADYKVVATDVLEEARSKPKKAVLIAAGLGGIFTAQMTNPDELSFRNQLVLYTNELILLSDLIRNPDSDFHIRYLNTCQNEGLIRRLNLIFFSLVWIDNYHPDCKIYSAQCTYLKPRYLTFHRRIVDIGLFNQWLIMRWKMRDYDINAEEWK